MMMTLDDDEHVTISVPDPVISLQPSLTLHLRVDRD